MMKRFLTWIFVFLMLLPCAFAEEGGGPRWQGFRDLPWGAIEEEIAEREGRVADRHLEISELCLDLVYSGMAYGDYAGAEAAYILYDGALVCAGYMIPGAEEEAMTQALEERFGRPNGDGRLIFRSILSLVRPEEENDAILQKAPTAWDVDGTGVILYPEGDRLVLLCIGLGYMSGGDAELPAEEEDEDAEAEETEETGETEEPAGTENAP